jgi:hypothetical protein
MHIIWVENEPEKFFFVLDRIDSECGGLLSTSILSYDIETKVWAHVVRIPGDISFMQSNNCLTAYTWKPGVLSIYKNSCYSNDFKILCGNSLGVQSFKGEVFILGSTWDGWKMQVFRTDGTYVRDFRYFEVLSYSYWNNHFRIFENKIYTFFSNSSQIVITDLNGVFLKQIYTIYAFSFMSIMEIDNDYIIIADQCSIYLLSHDGDVLASNDIDCGTIKKSIIIDNDVHFVISTLNYFYILDKFGKQVYQIKKCNPKM